MKFPMNGQPVLTFDQWSAVCTAVCFCILEEVRKFNSTCTESTDTILQMILTDAYACRIFYTAFHSRFGTFPDVYVRGRTYVTEILEKGKH